MRRIIVISGREKIAIFRRLFAQLPQQIATKKHYQEPSRTAGRTGWPKFIWYLLLKKETAWTQPEYTLIK